MSLITEICSCTTSNIFKNNPDILNYYREKFKYILVDEYQDTNRANIPG